MSEAVNHPKHYGGEHNPYEHIKVCDAWGLDYRLGNCTKYICRAGKKGNNALEDLKKAAWYLNDAIKQLEPIKPPVGFVNYPAPSSEIVVCKICGEEDCTSLHCRNLISSRTPLGPNTCQCKEPYAMVCVNCGNPPAYPSDSSEPTKAVHDG